MSTAVKRGGRGPDGRAGDRARRRSSGGTLARRRRLEGAALELGAHLVPREEYERPSLSRVGNCLFMMPLSAGGRPLSRCVRVARALRAPRGGPPRAWASARVWRGRPWRGRARRRAGFGQRTRRRCPDGRRGVPDPATRRSLAGAAPAEEVAAGPHLDDVVEQCRLVIDRLRLEQPPQSSDAVAVEDQFGRGCDLGAVDEPGGDQDVRAGEDRGGARHDALSSRLGADRFPVCADAGTRAGKAVVSAHGETRHVEQRHFGGAAG